MGLLPHKFPRTPHLWGSACTRDDRVLSARETELLLAEPLIGEEKVDGANLGIGFEADQTAPVVQNRGHLLGRGEHAQYAPLWGWLAERTDALRDLLGTKRLLFGEWCYARHSIAYPYLPSYFLAFDLYDKTEQSFLARAELEELCALCEIHTTPILFRSKVLRTTEQLDTLVQTSNFSDERMEGIYLRKEQQGRVVGRWKWVRKDFTAGITEHWRSRPVEPNRIGSKT